VPWKLVEVPDDGEDTLSDCELLGVKISLFTSACIANPGDPADSTFGRIWTKLRPHFGNALLNEVSK
jgi:hypothetical protein